MDDINLNYPTGNVTFLFTDIEGSTKLAQDHPEKVSYALLRHNEILRNAIESNNGYVFKIVGDAFCSAFENAGDAVIAAVEIQRNLSDEKWDDAVIKIRIGIHSGYAEWNGNDYMGFITLARVSRVMSAAYGEQIIISNDAYELYLEDPRPARQAKAQRKNEYEHDQESLVAAQSMNHEVYGISFRDLGERRLKDVIQPIRLFQIFAKGLRDNFPPLKTLDARPNNLPVQLTSFIGREEDIKITKELLKHNRLLTITGSGGAGKTRLSLQTGAEIIDGYTNGVWFLELAAIKDPDSIPTALINVFGLKEEMNFTPEKSLIEHLKNKEILIILDNCEHLIKACAVIAELLLSSCPGIKIIATSREAMNIPGEQIYKIPPLKQPDPKKNDTPEQLSQFESVRLFIERAYAVNPKFKFDNKNASAIAGICSHLDGIPLAIELAAARINILTPEKILERLDDKFNLLTGGKRNALPRQQTLKALIDWSFDLLTENEKILWSRLSIFCGLSLEAAEEICSDELIQKDQIMNLLYKLSQKSILIFDESKDRYRLLETIKQYGREKLENENKVFSKFLDYFLDLSQKAKRELKSINFKIWLDKLEEEHNNILTAIHWGLNNEKIDKVVNIVDSLRKFWEIRGQYSTGIKILDSILKKKENLNLNTKANLLNLTGKFNNYQGNFDIADKFFKESLNIYKKTGDKMGISTSTNNLGSLAYSQGKLEQAKKLFEESINIKKEIGDNKGIAGSMNNLGALAFSIGEYNEAKKYYEESLAIRKAIEDKIGISASLNNLGGLELYKGNFADAKNFFEESLKIKREIGDKKGIATVLGNIGVVTKYMGDFELTKKIFEESISIFREIGNKSETADFLRNLGDLLSSKNYFEEAIKNYEESLKIFEEIGDIQGKAASLTNLGKMMISANNFETAKKYLEESLTIFSKIGYKFGIALSLFGLGKLAFNQGEYEKAEKFFKKCLIINKEIGNKTEISESINAIGIVAHRKGDIIKSIKLLAFSDKAIESSGAVLDEDAKILKDESIANLKERLSKEEYANYWEEGQKMVLEEVYLLIIEK